MNDFNREQFDKFLAGLKFPPNPFQLKVLESIAFGSGNIVVVALAGSGKTSLLEQTAHLLNVMGETSTEYMAFNVKIRDELNERLPHPHIATNSHRLGLQVLNATRKSSVDNIKWRKLAQDIIEGEHFDRAEQYQKRRALESLCSKVMLNNVDTSDHSAIIGIAVHYRIEGVYSAEENRVDDRLIRLVKRAVDKSIQIWENTGAINFDEMLYIPVIRNLQPQQFKWVFVDECQDLNILQQELAYRSCEPGGRMIFVGDRRQAIYGFAGADAASFDRIIEHTSALVLPLNTCYRCPTTHIDLAKHLVPELEAAPNAALGLIEYAKEDDLYKLVSKGSLVMCRLNAPLISAYFDLIKNKIPAKVMGKDIGKDLINTLDRVAELDGFEYDEAVKYLDQFLNQQTRVLQQREGSEAQIEILQDKIECLIVCVENFRCTDLQCLKDVLMDLFGDDDKENWKNMVALCTVHKAKGLEADETFILRPEKMPLTRPGQQAWELSQELNIKYVALTRSKRRMVIMSEAPIQMAVKPLPEAAPVSKWNAPLAEMMEPRGDEAIAVAEQEPPMARLINSRGIDVETGEVVESKPEPVVEQPRVTGNLKADLKAFAKVEAPSTALIMPNGKLIRIDNPPAEVEITPIVVTPPRKTLDQIVESLSVAEIDRMIEVLTAAREKKAVENV